MYQYDILECVFATPVLFPDDTNNSNISIVVTQASSLFLLKADTLQVLWCIRIDGVGSFPRSPEILNNEGYLFIQDSSGTLLAIKGLREIMKKDTMNVKISTVKVIKVLKVCGETFGGVRILKVEGRESSKSSDSSSGNNSSETAIVFCRALIGSRDDRIRCFHFSL